MSLQPDNLASRLKLLDERKGFIACIKQYTWDETGLALFIGKVEFQNLSLDFCIGNFSGSGKNVHSASILEI
jgi:hypothetical protein